MFLSVPPRIPPESIPAVLEKNGYQIKSILPCPTGCVASWVLDSGPVIYLYGKRGNVLVRGHGDVPNVQDILEAAGWVID